MLRPAGSPTQRSGRTTSVSRTIVCDKIVHAAVVGNYAYVVISATLFFELKGGQNGSKPGILTLTCAKQGDEWKVGSQAWARLS